MADKINKTLSEIIRTEYELRFSGRPLDDWHRDQIGEYLKNGFLSGDKDKMSIHFDRVLETREGVENDMLTFLMNYYVSTKEYLIHEGFFVEEYEYNNKDYASLCVRLYDKNMTKEERKDYEEKSVMNEMRAELSSLGKERNFIKFKLRELHNKQKFLKGRIWYLRGAIRRHDKFISDNSVILDKNTISYLNNEKRRSELCSDCLELRDNKKEISVLNKRLYDVEFRIKGLNGDYIVAFQKYERIGVNDSDDEADDYICGMTEKSYGI